jgi:hypothetical protein
MWNTDDLMAQTGAVFTAGDPNAYMFDAQGTQHVVYRGDDGHVHELWWDGQWHTENLTGITNAVRCLGDPSGYVFVAQGPNTSCTVGPTIIFMSYGGMISGTLMTLRLPPMRLMRLAIRMVTCSKRRGPSMSYT